MKYKDQFDKTVPVEIIDALIGKEAIFKEVCETTKASPEKVRELLDTILDQEIPENLIKDYQNGLLTEKFCAGCGAECCMMSDPIAVNWPDVQRLAKGLGTNNKKIVKEYLEPHTLSDFSHLEYKIKKTKPCQWLNEKTKRCTIYELRPHICRTYPVIPNRENLSESKLDAPIFCKVTASMIKQDIINRLA
jgi:Fe-S-cluster containining protein